MAADGLSKRARIKVVADDDDKFPTSVHKVLSNDDLLTEILLRLPTLSLHLFKPVCKQWLSLITSIDLSGLIINYGDGRRWGLEYGYYNFVSFDPRFAAKKRIIFSFNSMARIMQSCNGLLMFYIDGIGEYGIYNPLIDRFKMLPQICDLHYQKYLDDHMKMAFDPTKSPCYKVVHVGGLYLNRIQTYSSETGVWSVCDGRFPYESFKGFFHGIYWNGAIHWLNFPNSLHVKLDIVDHPVLTYIETPLPPLAVKAQWYSDCRLLKSHDSLLLLCKDDNHSGYYIYEMKNGYSAWLVKYFVNLDDIMSPYPTWRTSIYLDCRDMFSIVLGEQDEDSFMVINLSEKIIQYKFASKTVIGLFDPGKAVIRRSEGIEYIA